MGLLSERSEDDEERGEISIAGLDGLDDGASESTYELDDWTPRGRAMLRERLEVLGVPHSWEGETVLVVATTDEAWVERILDQVEDDLADALDPDVPQVAYDLSGWGPEHRDRLFALLEEEAVPFGIDGEELFAHEIDEQRVDELIDAVLSPDAEPDPVAGRSEAMGELFVAADLLVHEPGGAAGALRLVDARAGAQGGPPYGMDAAWWDGLLADVDALAALLDVEPPDEDAVADQATRLRDTLRPYV
jgi:hypothetical protein